MSSTGKALLVYKLFYNDKAIFRALTITKLWAMRVLDHGNDEMMAQLVFLFSLE